MTKKLAVFLTMVLCAVMIAGTFATGCSKGSEPQKAAAPAKEEPAQKAAPAPAPAPSQAEAEAEEEDEDKFGC